MSVNVGEYGMDIDRNSHEAVYLQLATQLIDLATSSKPGAQFPTEDDLIDTFKVSRTTVRRAMQVVVDKGLALRRRGKGTFVTGSRPVQSATKLVPFVETFTTAGIHPNVSLRDFIWVQNSEALESVPEEIRDTSDSFLLARRLYESEETPLSVAEIYLPREIGAQVSMRDVEKHPIYQVLSQRMGVTLQEAELRVTICQAPIHIAELLGVEEGSFVARMVRVTKDTKGNTVECTVAHIHPDAFELEATVAADLPPNVSYTFNAQKRQ